MWVRQTGGHAKSKRKNISVGKASQDAETKGVIHNENLPHGRNGVISRGWCKQAGDRSESLFVRRTSCNNCSDKREAKLPCIVWPEGKRDLATPHTVRQRRDANIYDAMARRRLKKKICRCLMSGNPLETGWICRWENGRAREKKLGNQAMMRETHIAEGDESRGRIVRVG